MHTAPRAGRCQIVCQQLQELCTALLAGLAHHLCRPKTPPVADLAHNPGSEAPGAPLAPIPAAPRSAQCKCDLKLALRLLAFTTYAFVMSNSQPAPGMYRVLLPHRLHDSGALGAKIDHKTNTNAHIIVKRHALRI